MPTSLATRGEDGGSSRNAASGPVPPMNPASLIGCGRVGRLVIRVGTSGWSHPEWVGPFYPVALRDAPHAWLAYYASRFRCVEINGTFDAFPDEDLVAAWARAGLELSAASSPFEFSLKLPRECTH